MNEGLEKPSSGLPENMPVKYTPEQVEGKLTAEELAELNGLVEKFPGFSGEEDPDYVRWLELDRRAN